MIIGVGHDLLEIDRMKKVIKREGFLLKYFTENECALFDSRNNNVATIAANFSGKEAVSKLLGTGIRGFSLKDIEILRDELGKPVVYLHNDAKILAEKQKLESIHMAISHTDHLVSVVAIGESSRYMEDSI